MFSRLITASLLVCLQSLTAHAQLSPAAKLRLVSANQFGIMEYCHDQGVIGADAVDAEREAVASVPSSNLSTVRAEDAGRSGISVSPEGDRMTVAELASQQGTTVKALCADLAQSALQFRAAMRGTTKSALPGR